MKFKIHSFLFITNFYNEQKTLGVSIFFTNNYLVFQKFTNCAWKHCIWEDCQRKFCNSFTWPRLKKKKQIEQKMIDNTDMYVTSKLIIKPIKNCFENIYIFSSFHATFCQNFLRTQRTEDFKMANFFTNKDIVKKLKFVIKKNECSGTSL